MSEQIEYLLRVSPEAFKRLAKCDTPHDHGTFDPDCWRCDLSRDEAS
jgi:hypothetical protein